MRAPHLLAPQLLARTLPFALYIALLAAGPWLAKHLPAPIAPWLYALPLTMVTVVLLAFRRHYVELRDVRTVTPAQWALAVACGLAVFVAWIHLDLPFLTLGTPTAAWAPDAAYVRDPLWLAMRLAGAALMVPVMEELFWRSFVMRWIDRHDFLSLPAAQVSAKALMVSALAFGFEHTLWFAGLLAGLVYGWLYRGRSLWVPVAAHGVTNLALGVWVISTGNWRFW